MGSANLPDEARINSYHLLRLRIHCDDTAARSRRHRDLSYALPLARGVPMRMGIASGSFEAVRFRSDITLDGGDHAAHFLGSAVVRAHATESCGIKGCRILLHPSAVALLDDPAHNPPIPAPEHAMHLECAANECHNKAGVLREINYWSFGPTDEKKAWRALQEMWDGSPETQHHHYSATAKAINRMRMIRGEASIGDLRRRTIPRASSAGHRG